jgi:hypothetical protein
MERSERIINAIKKAISNLECTMDALISRRGEVEQTIWQAAAETEYAVFLLSLLQKSENHPWKTELEKIGEVEVGPALITAQDLLKEAEKGFMDNFEEAYRKAWAARQYILAAQHALRGKSKKAS